MFPVLMSLLSIEWYAELDNDTLNKIYEIHKVDFEIFGYSKWGDKEFPMVKTLYNLIYRYLNSFVF